MDPRQSLSPCLATPPSGSVSTARWRELLTDNRGASYVEFLIAFLPMLFLFMCIWQFGRILTTRIQCDHAAAAAARAAAVIIAEPEENGKVLHQVSDDTKSQISIAAFASLAPAIAADWISSISLKLPKSLGSKSNDEQLDFTPTGSVFEVAPTRMVHVRLTTQFRCKLPPADYVMCKHSDDAGWTFPIITEASFPYQGARYDFKPAEPESGAPPP